MTQFQKSGERETERKEEEEEETAENKIIPEKFPER